MGYFITKGEGSKKVFWW